METVKISELQTVQEITGDEQIPVEYGGKNYKITPRQIAPYVDIENLQTFDSITGAEKVIVVKDGKAQGLVTLTQIRQVVLPMITEEELNPDALELFDGGININTGKFTLTNTLRIEIPITKRNTVFTISVSSITGGITRTAFGFTTERLNNLKEGGIIPYAGEGGFYLINTNETITVVAPDDAKYFVFNSKVGVPGLAGDVAYKIQIGELLEDKVEELSARVNLLEQSAVAPAALDSVSREEFDALRKEIEKLKSNTK